MNNTDPQSWEESVVSVRAEMRDDDVALSEANLCARIYRGAVVQGVTDDETLIGPLVRLFQTPHKRVDVEERFELYQQVAECAPFGERVEEATAHRGRPVGWSRNERCKRQWWGSGGCGGRRGTCWAGAQRWLLLVSAMRSSQIH